MPFDPAPVPQETKTSQFQKFAEAMLRGCAITRPTLGGDLAIIDKRTGGLSHACAWAAIRVGLYGAHMKDWYEGDGCLDSEMRTAYEHRYGRDYVFEYINGDFTREQIAARIAAL